MSRIIPSLFKKWLKSKNLAVRLTNTLATYLDAF